MKWDEDLAHLLVYFRKSGATQEKLQNRLAEDILLSKITGSDYLNHRVIFKGGVLLYYLTKGRRGYTQDIDFDIADFVICPETANQFVRYLNESSLYPKISVRLLRYKKLNLLAYRGLRLDLELFDGETSLSLTADVGHYDGRWPSPQNRQVLLSFSSTPITICTESNEMMIAEKLSSFALHGTDNRRYKDFFDAFWLIRNTLHDEAKVASTLEAIGVHRAERFRSFKTMKLYLIQVLSNSSYLQCVEKDGKNWLGLPISTMASILCQFVSSLPER